MEWRCSMAQIFPEPARSMANTPVSRPRLVVDSVVGLSKVNSLYIVVDLIH